jgi:hypothetical protein
VILRRTLAGAGFLGIAFLAGCKVDQAAFDNRIFACDPSAKDPGCGSDSSGKPMVCYPASLLDGTDFCAPSCDMAMSSPAGEVCVEGGAELGFCDPSMTNSCGQGALGCLRTDVTTQQGVCTTMTPCTVDKDCTDPVRSTCAATFLTQLYANASSTSNGSNATMFDADHLYCLQKNCKSGESSCSPGQSCLPLLVPASANPPDICVPNCDSSQNCPPNHVCFQKISGPANPAICIPGLLGFICETDINCLVGSCLADDDPTAELNLCTIKCNSDADCAVFDSDQGTFGCIIRSDGQGYCESPYSYRGNSCHTDDDCVRNGIRDTTTSCFFTSPPESASDLGTCLRPCDGGSCAPRAGIGQTCVPFSSPAGTPTDACFPGIFPLPCATTANCVGDLTCRGANAATNTLGNCTTLCQTDADCDADRWTAGQAYCASAGVCAPLVAGGSPCQSDDQCQTKVCLLPPDGGTSTSATCAMPTP